MPAAKKVARSHDAFVTSDAIELILSVLTGSVFDGTDEEIMIAREELGLIVTAAKNASSTFDDKLRAMRQTKGADWLPDADFRKPVERKKGEKKADEVSVSDIFASKK